MWDIKEPTYYSKRVGNVDPGGVANLSWHGLGVSSVRKDLKTESTRTLGKKKTISYGSPRK